MTGDWRHIPHRPFFWNVFSSNFYESFFRVVQPCEDDSVWRRLSTERWELSLADGRGVKEWRRRRLRSGRHSFSAWTEPHRTSKKYDGGGGGGEEEGTSSGFYVDDKTVIMYNYYLCSYKYEEKKHVYVGFAPPPPPLRYGLCLSKCFKTSLMYIFWFIILFINDVTQGGGGGWLAKRWHWMTWG